MSRPALTLYAMEEPQRGIRAVHSESTITVYQAYPPEIGLPAAREGRFPAAWKRDRMTWVIKRRAQTSSLLTATRLWAARETPRPSGRRHPKRPARALITAKRCGQCVSEPQDIADRQRSVSAHHFTSDPLHAAHRTVQAARTH